MNRRRILASLGSHTPTAKDYVQDGLVAMWDVDSFSESMWFDCVGNHNFTVLDGVSHNEKMVRFESENGCVADWVLSADDAKTFECVIRVENNPGIATVAKFTDSYSMSNYQVPYRLLNIRDLEIKNSGYLGATRCVKVEIGVTSNISWKYGDDQKIPIAAFKNATEVSTSHIYGAASNYNGSFIKTVSGSAFEIGCIRMYSRELSLEETEANYAIDKARFNLT